MGAAPVLIKSGILIMKFIGKILFKVNKFSIIDLEMIMNNNVDDAKA